MLRTCIGAPLSAGPERAGRKKNRPVSAAECR